MTGAVGPTSAIPPVLDEDDDDVAWALQTAQVQWTRQAYGDALTWLQRAVDTAEGIGATGRAEQLRVSAAALTQHMWSQTVAAAPATSHRASAPALEEMDSLDEDVEFEEEESPASPEDSAALDDLKPDSVRLPSPSELSQPVNEAFGFVSPIAGLGASEHPEPSNAEEASPTEPEASAPEATEPERTEPEASAPEATEPERTEPERTEPGASASDSISLPDTVDESAEAAIEGILLVEVRGLQDLPDDVQRRLAASARVVALAPDEEVGDFGAALVLSGTVYIMPTLADAACASASVADVVFASGSLTPGIPIRVVGAEAGTRVAVFSREELIAEMAQCPWVEEDLRQVADHYQALAGAGMGAMGERLDDALRGLITSRCEVQHYRPGDVVVELGHAVEALYIVGAGSLVLTDADQKIVSEAHPGDFIFAAQIMRAGPAPSTVRAGSEGALLLRTERQTAHELLLSVPPLLEILAGI